MSGRRFGWNDSTPRSCILDSLVTMAEARGVMRYPLLVGLLAAASIASGQVLVVGTRTAGGEISFQPVEEFQINMGTQVRFLADPKGPVDSNTIGRQKKYDLTKEWAQFGGIIRNDGKGRLIHWKGPEKATEVVIPEKFSIKGTAQPADVPGTVALTLVHNKKAKQADALDPQQFFALLSGTSADRAVFDFVTKDWAFLSRDEQFAAVVGFVKSFRDKESVTEYRNALSQKLTDGLANFEDGKPYKDLTDLRPFGGLASKAFADDKGMVDLDKQILAKIDFVEKRKALLRSLAIAADWDAFLAVFQDFDNYQWSFPDLMALRQQAIEESARLHALRAKAFDQRGDFAAIKEDGKERSLGDFDAYQAAIKEASFSQQRDPENSEIKDLVDGEKLKASKIEAARAVVTHKGVEPNTQEERRFKQAIQFADLDIRDKKFTNAEQDLADAKRLDKDAPEVVLGTAKLYAARGELADALPLLDQYDKMVTVKADLDKGVDVRNEVEHDLRSRKESAKQEIDNLIKEGDYTKLDGRLKEDLRMDPNDPDFLYNAGVVAGVLRQTDRARDLLNKYLERSDSLVVDPKKSDRAVRVRNALAPAAPKGAGAPNWMSGRPLAAGVYYCPESLAYQLPIDSVAGDKIHMNFRWDKNHLESITTTFEDQLKGPRTYRSLLGENPAAAALPNDKLGNFYFRYVSPEGPLLEASTDAPAQGAAPPAFQVKVAKDKAGYHLVDAANAPMLALWSSTYVDTQVLNFLGSRVATTVAGNSYFDPFLWDGLHYFTLRYDNQGRVDSAQEWNADNLVRFTWDGDKLKEIRAYHEGNPTPYYRRALTYAGGQMQSEDFTLDGHTGKIRYVYENKVLQKIEIDQDGKNWTVKPRA